MENQNPQIEFIEALIKAQCEFKHIEKSSKGYNYVYAPYEEVYKAIQPALASNGFAILHKTEEADGKLLITTQLMHKSGWIEKSTQQLTVDAKTTAQAKGSAITYAKRYNLVALTGVPVGGEDDDGEEDRKAKASPDQIKEISALIGDEPESAKRVCEYYNVGNIEELDADKARHAIVILKKKNEKKAKVA